MLNVGHRHASIQAVARRFEMDHLTDPDARQVAVVFARTASELLARISRDDVEVTKALDKLADSRDGFIRATIYAKAGG